MVGCCHRRPRRDLAVACVLCVGAGGGAGRVPRFARRGGAGHTSGDLQVGGAEAGAGACRQKVQNMQETPALLPGPTPKWPARAAAGAGALHRRSQRCRAARPPPEPPRCWHCNRALPPAHPPPARPPQVYRPACVWRADRAALCGGHGQPGGGAGAAARGGVDHGQDRWAGGARPCLERMHILVGWRSCFVCMKSTLELSPILGSR